MFKIYSRAGKITQVIKEFAWNFDYWHSIPRPYMMQRKQSYSKFLSDLNTPTTLCLWPQKYAGVDKHSCTQAHTHTHNK